MPLRIYSCERILFLPTAPWCTLALKLIVSCWDHCTSLCITVRVLRLKSLNLSEMRYSLLLHLVPVDNSFVNCKRQRSNDLLIGVLISWSSCKLNLWQGFDLTYMRELHLSWFCKLLVSCFMINWLVEGYCRWLYSSKNILCRTFLSTYLNQCPLDFLCEFRHILVLAV